ncbi:MAG: hypothetical protein HFG08_09060 [Oscillibacter sp.]|nr:hypothetical protein [Oscillibacter sp.]
MNRLAHQFEAELRDKMLLAKKECRYDPIRFNQMLEQYGGVETAKRLIKSARETGIIPTGYARLLEEGRLDLTVEHSVYKAEYQSLFSPDEVEFCKEFLGI